MSNELGFSEGDVCRRMGCVGTIGTHESENCSCHIAPPCGSCTKPRGFCDTCDWQEKDDRVFNDFVVNTNPATGVYRTWSQRPLDPTKLDYHNKAHTNSSMIKEGVYPLDMTRADVRKVVDGTFGGRFEHFKDGKFKFIAYTD